MERMQRSTWLAVILAVLIALGIGAWQWYGGGKPLAEENFADQVAAGRESNAAGLSQGATAAAAQAATQAFAHRFDSPYGFSFGYPDTFTVGESQDTDTGAETITVQDASKHVGFQIYVSAWEGGKVTQEAVARDLPQIGAHDFAQVSVGGAEGLSFGASDPNFGDSVQVWFARGGSLYQISTYATQAPLLTKVLPTWQWR